MSCEKMINKSILIVGATSFLAGGIIETLLLKGGYDLVLTSRSEESLYELIRRFNLPDNTRKYTLDLEQESSIGELIVKLGNIDGVVFCAGYNEYVPVKFLKNEVVDKIFKINYFSFVSLIKGLINKKQINKGGSIVAISSISSQLGVTGTGAYAGSKAALNSTVKVLASELAPMKIRANALCPGIVISPMLNQENVDIDDLMKQEKDYPLGFGTPIDIGFAVSYLLSDESRWMTGNTLNIDGGLTLL